MIRAELVRLRQRGSLDIWRALPLQLLAADGFTAARDQHTKGKRHAYGPEHDERHGKPQQVRVLCRLIATHCTSHLWADTFDLRPHIRLTSPVQCSRRIPCTRANYALMTQHGKVQWVRTAISLGGMGGYAPIHQ